MIIKYVKFIFFVLMVVFALPAMAQYPIIPDSIQAASDARLAIGKNRSDEAWKQALPIVKADEKNGKPFIPWAAKPSDLPQAKIPSFPGAEGGGAYSFGGRGGKCMWLEPLLTAALARLERLVSKVAQESLCLMCQVLSS